MKSTLSILYFIRKSQVKKNGLASIMIRITIGGEKVQFYSRIEVEPLKWDQKAQKAKGRSADAKQVNNNLNKIRMQLYTSYSRLLGNDDYVQPSKIRDTFLSNEEESTLIYQFKRHNKHYEKLVPNTITRATYTRYELTLKRLVEFMKHQYRISDIQLHKITPEFIDLFFSFLQEKYKCSHNTATKFIQRFRTIVSYATDTGIIKTNPFNLYHISIEKTTRVYLNQQEINAIWNKKFATRRLDQVRDIFVFSCYTGVSYIDLCSLTRSNIELGFDNRLWIKINRHKTHQSAHIPLLKIPLQIIKKYERQYNDEAIFPINSNQKMNEYLNEIANICGISKKISFHVARHSFSTTVTLGNGISIETISKMLGHSNIKTTQIYTKVTDLKISKEMEKLLDKDFK